MKTKLTHTFIQRAALLVLLSTINPQLTTLAQGTAFTYQGRLSDSGQPANGTNYGMLFYLYDAPTGGSLLGNLGIVSVTVSNGLFTVPLTFDQVFDGNPRWLEINVQKNGGSYSTLTPRQQLTPTPYAITAGRVISGGLSSGAYTNAVTFNHAGNSFTGNGGGLTALNPTNLLGTIPDARLSGNVALRNGGNVFSGNQFITNGAVGVGTMNPAATFHVNPGTNPGSALVLGNDPASGGFTAMTFGLSSPTNGYGSIQAIRASGSAYGDVILNPIAGNVGVGTTTPTNRLQVAGKAQATEFVGNGTIPIGGIIMWTGTTAPDGWTLCNGANGTPDLRGRFILGSGAGTGLTPRTIGGTGGAETKVLSWQEMPVHNHGFIVPATGYNATYNNRSEVFAASNEAINNNIQNSTDSAGGSQPFDKMPPYYVLAFIMRTQ